MKIHPAIAILVIALSVVAIGVKFWADGEAKALGGPAQLLTDPSGRIYIQIQNQLLEHDKDGEFLRRHDLGAFGVDSVIGALGFFSDGDLLLRRGPDRRSLNNKIAAYRRQENTASLTPDTENAGLVRCDLQTRKCGSFASPAIDLKSTFGLFIDWQTDDVLITDTSRHSLRKYSSSGKQLAGPVRGFKFPNKLMLYNGNLLIADTNHHRISIVKPDTKDFGDAVDAVNVITKEAGRRGERWPSHFARVGEEWWVNNMQNDMRNGGVYAFSSDWKFIRRIALPDAADPIAIVPFRDGALISDWDNDRVYHIAASGKALSDFQSEGLEAVLQESRSKRLHYSALSWSGVVIFIPVLIGLIFKSIVTPRPPLQTAAAERNVVSAGRHGALTWFEPDPKVVSKVLRALRIAGLAIVGLGLLLIFIAVMYGGTGFALQLMGPVVALTAVFILILRTSRSNVATAIGFHGDQIILRDHNGKESRSPIHKVVYDKTTIVTPDAAVFLGQPNMPLYDSAVLREQIFPRLAAAEQISAWQIQKRLLRQRHPQTVTLLVIVATAVVAFLTLFVFDVLKLS